VIARKTFQELWPLVLIYLLVMQGILIPAIVLWEDLAIVGRKVAPILMFTHYLKTGLFKEVIESTANYEKYFAMQQFFKGGNIGEDTIWDRWRVEGPTFVWYFRGTPHVHTWVNLAHYSGDPKARRARL